jgi:hypothetical protein
MRLTWLALSFLPLTLAAKDPPTWVELGSGQVLARQVLVPGVTGQAGTCPSVNLKGGSQSSIPMTVRGPAPSGWPVVCEAAIPAGTTSAKIGSIDLALPKTKISNVVVVGDTGCAGTISSGEKASPTAEEDEEPAAKTQDCSGGWPLQQLSQSVTKQAPDLIIHVGDYVYVSAENWLMWDQQFFTPAAKMLRAAPWIFVRGNHETCGRHGPGYFYLLDPRSATACTSDATDPILVSTGGQQYVMLDSSGATCDFPMGSSSSACSGNTKVPPDQQIAAWTTLLTEAQALVPTGTTATLLTHRPVWGAKSENGSTTPTGFCASGSSKRVIASLNATLQGAWAAAKPTAFSMVYSGHTHIFALMTFAQGALPQLVMGDSGTELAHALPTQLSDCKLGTAVDPQPTQYLPLSTLDSLQKWGFGAITGSNLTVYSSKGDAKLKCTIAATSAACSAPKK